MAVTTGVSGSSGGGGGAVTLAASAVSAGAYVAGSLVDGAITTLGSLADAAVGDASGSVNAHLRQVAKVLTAGTVIVQGGSAAGSVPAGNPLQMGIYDGTNVQYARASADGTNALLVAGAISGAGSDGVTNVSTLKNAGGGTTPLATLGGVWNGTGTDRARSAVSATGTSGTGLPASGPLLWDTVGATTFIRQAGDGSGRAMVVGAAATGVAVSGNPVLVGGKDGSGNVQPLATDTSGRVSVAATQSGTWNVTVNTALPTGANTLGAVTGPGAVALATDRTTAAAPFAAQLSDGAAFYVGAKTGQLPSALVGGRLDINVGAGSVAATQSGTWTVQPGNTANTTAWKVDGSAVTQPVAGDVAHGASDSGNPVKRGGVAIAHGANPTAVAAAQRTNLYANRAGVPFVIGGHPNIQTIASNFTGAQTDTAIVTVATGLKIVVTGFMIVCHTANTVNVSARLGFGTANTPAYGAAQLIGTHPGMAPGSGFGRGGGSGIIGVGTDDQDLRLTCSVPTGGSVDCMVSYYTIES